MYKCLICRCLFDEPRSVRDRDTRQWFDLCPKCGELDIKEVVECCECGEYEYEDNAQLKGHD